MECERKMSIKKVLGAVAGGVIGFAIVYLSRYLGGAGG
jgi:hypothetical protein